MKNSKPKSIKHSFLFSFISAALVPFLVLSIMLSIYTYQLYNQSREYNSYVQNQIATNISYLLQEHYQIISSFYSEEVLQELFELKTIDDYYKDKNVNTVISNITRSQTTSSRTTSIYLYIEDSDVILSSKGILDTQTYYSINKDEINCSYEQWIEYLKLPEGEQIYKKTQNDNDAYINFFYNVIRRPYISFPKDETAITLAMSSPESSCFDGVQNISWLPYCNTYVFDSNNRLIFGKPLYNDSTHVSELSQIVNRKGFFNTVVLLPISVGATTWNIAFNANKLHIFKMPLYMTFLTLLFLIICIILIFIIAKIVLKKNYSPIEQLSSLLNISSQHTPYESLINSIRNLLVQNENYSADIKTQKKQFRNILLNKLLQGDLSTQLTYSLENHDIVFPYKNFAVIVFTFDMSRRYGDIFVQNELLADTINEFLNTSCKSNDVIFHSSYENSQISVICNLRTNDESLIDDISPLVKICCENAYADFDIILRASISNIQSSYTEISKAYIEAIETSFAPQTAHTVLRYKNILKTRKQSFGPIQEKELLNCLQAGDFSSVTNILNETLSVNISSNTKYYEYFVYDILSYYSKLPYLLKLDKDTELTDILSFPNLYSKINPQEKFLEFLLEVSEKICNYILDKKINSNQNIAHNVAKYIASNYFDYNLSTTSICDYLHCSKSYLTGIFTAEYNVSIHEYIHQFRINTAKELLNSSMTISEISQKVGYSNQRTFNRIFKNYEGVSPTEYKRNLLINHE